MRALVAVVAAAIPLTGGVARAQTFLDIALTLGKEPEAVVLPFTIATAGTYRLTVTDFGSTAGPPRLARADAAVTHGSELVTSQGVTTATTTGAAMRTFTATPGEHRLTLIGQPNAPAATVGSAGVRIDDPASGAVLLETLQAFETPRAPTASPATFEHELAVQGGAYTLEITDFALPQPLAMLQTTVIRRSDGAIVANVTGAGPIALTAGASDTFEVFLYAELAPTAARGLVGVNLRDVGGAVAAAEVHELGDWPHRYPVDLAAAAQLNASLADLGFPLPLAALGAEVVRDARRAASRFGPGVPVSFAAAAGRYDVYVDAVPATTSPGSFGLRLVSPAGALLDEVESVTAPQPLTDVAAIDTHFDVATAGSYALTLTDFGAAGFFDAFESLALALARDDQIVQTLTASGTITFAATPGRYSVAILADPSGAAGEGLLGVRVADAAGATTLLDFTEAVGTDFRAATFTVAGAGNVDVRIADLAFPASFARLRAAVTHGAERVAEIVGAGTFTFAATPGVYHVSLLAEPAAGVGYGTLGVRASVQAPGPVVTLTASAASVTVGSAVTLTWSAANASTCTASGGWSGARAASGTESVPGLRSATTFTLTCAGAGGSQAASVTVGVTAEQRSGGGSVDALLLALLMGTLLAARRRGNAPR